MSSEIVWNVIKNDSSFLRKQKHGNRIAMFATDKMNVENVYSPKCMGVCQKRAVGVNNVNNHIVLSIKSTKNPAKPIKASADSNVKSEASVRKEVLKGCYKPSMEVAAAARYNAITRSLRRVQKKYVNKKRMMPRRA